MYLAILPCFRIHLCTLVQALRLCTGRTAYRGSRGIALPFHDHGTRRGWGVSVTPRPLFTPGKDPVSIVQESGWVPGPVWTGTENLPPGFDPRTVQPVASRYTDWATRPTFVYICSSVHHTDTASTRLVLCKLKANKAHIGLMNKRSFTLPRRERKNVGNR